jgi:hypothetical protein
LFVTVQQGADEWIPRMRLASCRALLASGA